MSSFQDASWLRRLWSLGAPGPPAVDYVGNVQVVNDRRFASSRERAPYASHSAIAAAAGAGVHNFVEITGTDSLGMPTTNLLHRALFELGMANVLTGVVRWGIAGTGALTTATRNQLTPIFLDPDPEVTPQIFSGTIATANIPAAAVALPRFTAIGQTAGTPSFPSSITLVDSMVALPFAASWLGNSLYFFGGDNEFFTFWLTWQAMRT